MSRRFLPVLTALLIVLPARAADADLNQVTRQIIEQTNGFR
jgi:hypothetical protein